MLIINAKSELKMLLSSISYEDLNQIYPERIKIEMENYVASIGGVGRPWDQLNQGAAKVDVIKDSDTFAIFQIIDPMLQRKQGSPWKIHLSIHPDDLGGAWDKVYPILIKNQIPNFKVSRQVVSIVMMSRMSLVSPSFLETHGLNQKDIEQSLEDIRRIHYGMQITIYITEDEEHHYNKLLEEIELCLYEAGIRPGIIDKSDRSLGIYCSVRHVGEPYTTHDRVSGYKSIVIKDPFKPVKLHHNKMRVSWAMLDFPRQIIKIKVTLQQVLDGKRKYDIAIIDKREFTQVCNVAKEYFTHWLLVLTKSQITGQESAPHKKFNKWIEEGYQLIGLIQGNKTRLLKEMEDVILSASRIELPKDRLRPPLQRINGTRTLPVFEYEDNQVTVPKRGLNTTDILRKLEQRTSFKTSASKQEPNPNLSSDDEQITVQETEPLSCDMDTPSVFNGSCL